MLSIRLNTDLFSVSNMYKYIEGSSRMLIAPIVLCRRAPYCGVCDVNCSACRWCCTPPDGPLADALCSLDAPAIARFDPNKSFATVAMCVANISADYICRQFIGT